MRLPAAMFYLPLAVLCALGGALPHIGGPVLAVLSFLAAVGLAAAGIGFFDTVEFHDTGDRR